MLMTAASDAFDIRRVSLQCTITGDAEGRIQMALPAAAGGGTFTDGERLTRARAAHWLGGLSQLLEATDQNDATAAAC